VFAKLPSGVFFDGVFFDGVFFDGLLFDGLLIDSIPAGWQMRICSNMATHPQAGWAANES
jgi:hypothetical protein